MPVTLKLTLEVAPSVVAGSVVDEVEVLSVSDVLGAGSAVEVPSPQPELTTIATAKIAAAKKLKDRMDILQKDLKTMVRFGPHSPTASNSHISDLSPHFEYFFGEMNEIIDQSPRNPVLT